VNNQTLTEENKCFIHTYIFSKSVKAVIVSINEVYRICITHISINSYPDIIPLSAILPHNTAAKNRLITRKIQINLHNEGFSFRRSDYIANCILECDSFQLSKHLLVSHRNIQLHSQSIRAYSTWSWGQNVPPKLQYLPAKLYGITHQKKAIFNTHAAPYTTQIKLCMVTL